MSKRNILIITLLFISFSCLKAQNIDTLGLSSTIQNILDSADIPGFSIAFIDKGQIIYSNAVGYKNYQSKEKVDGNTYFEAASLTKSITAYCAMRLVNEGELCIDTPLYKYLEYQPIEYDERYKKITARMVLSHTSGFPNWRRFNKDKKLDIKFTPGLKYSYSGEGYVYLQKVIEELQGKGLDSVADEMIFKPLKMDNSSMIFPKTNNFAKGHDIDKNPVNKWKPKNPNGAATLHTTATDYSRFLQEILNPKFINNSLIDEMTIPQIPICKEDSSFSFGLGFGLQIHKDDTLIWHWGNNDEFRAFFIISKKSSKGLVYFSNSTMGLSILERLIYITYSDSQIMSGWNNYLPYTHPYFVLRKVYNTHGIDSLFKRYQELKILEPDLYDEYLLNKLGYYVLGKDEITSAIELFKFNVTEYPDSYNVYNSLGEAYMKDNKRKLAIANYKNSLKLNPENKNAEKRIKELNDNLE